MSRRRAVLELRVLQAILNLPQAGATAAELGGGVDAAMAAWPRRAEPHAAAGPAASLTDRSR